MLRTLHRHVYACTYMHITKSARARSHLARGARPIAYVLRNYGDTQNGSSKEGSDVLILQALSQPLARFDIASKAGTHTQPRSAEARARHPRDIRARTRLWSRSELERTARTVEILINSCFFRHHHNESTLFSPCPIGSGDWWVAHGYGDGHDA